MTFLAVDHDDHANNPKSNQPRDHIRILTVLTLLSRALVAVLLSLSSYLPLFDASPRTVLHPSVFPSFHSSLFRWDVLHFAAVAKDGYAYEHQWAWFLGAPFLLRTGARLPTLSHDPTSSALVWTALLHTAIAVPTTHALYRLTMHHFRSPAFAFLSASLSLLPGSPVTLYFAPYAEPMVTFLSYKGMLACAQTRYLRASLYFTVAAAFRSNGALLALYVPWSLVVHPFLSSRQLPHLTTFIHAASCAVLPLLPSLAHQVIAFRAFCLPSTGVDAQVPSWCTDFPPSIYAHVQRTYWHVGFLSYWTPAQLPNIALALPLLVPLLMHSFSYLSPPHGTSQGLRPPTTTAHALHAALLGITLLTNAHTQIALRLLPALPSTYWAAATLLIERPWWGRAYVTWAVLWGATSVVLWGVFLPPA
ncbi:GPI mannosyltransferase 2 [Gloeopeniophorella convolvens]|nr:GPI mannosyltransferase 2 [Gloeopeniophorella convolvens]